jgi:hypothetical protein
VIPTIEGQNNYKEIFVLVLTDNFSSSQATERLRLPGNA